MKTRSLTSAICLLLVAFLAAGCHSKTTATGTGTSAAVATSAANVVATDGLTPTATDSATQCPSSNTTSFAKTKFVLHSGLAFGAFHRYLYKPYQAGTFASGAHGRIVAFVKAGTAALYIKREVRLAYEDTTSNPTLCKAIGAPLQKIGDDISAAITKLKGGDASGITAIRNNITSTESSAASNGDAIQEDPNAPLK